MEVVDRRETPPSCNLSEEGGSGGVSTEETPPPSCVLSEGEGGGVSVEGTSPPHILSKGRGLRAVGGKETPLSRISSEGGGGGWWQKNPFVSQFK